MHNKNAFKVTCYQR